MHKKLAFIIVCIFLPYLLIAQPSTIYIEQSGTDHEARTYQEGESSSLILGQHGSESIARISQIGFGADDPGLNLHANVYQNGFRNTLALTQQFDNLTAEVEQIGNNNRAFLEQTIALGELELSQHGDYNFAHVWQGGFGANATIEQFGKEGIVYINQGSGGYNAINVHQGEGSHGAMVEISQYTIYEGGNRITTVQGAGLHNYGYLAQSGDDNLMSLTQSGNFNEAYQYQSGGTFGYGWISGYRLWSYITQHGTGNYALSDQLGQYHTSRIVQEGTDNEASVYQSGTSYYWYGANTALVNQNGRENMAYLDQFGSNYAEINQTGNRNHANVSQTGSTMNEYEPVYNIVATQEGNDNSFNLYQEGTNNRMDVNQLGNANVADISQLGDNSSYDIYFLQEGHGNQAQIHTQYDLSMYQEGNWNQAILNGEGGGHWLYQLGNNNYALIESEGMFNTTNIFQGRDNNYAEVSQNGEYNYLWLDQTGYGNRAILGQTGNNNNLHVDQLGNNNYIHYTQTGNMLEARIEQIGNNLSVTIHQ